MIEKFLIRFCASEVRVMIARLHERPEDFGYGSRWRDLVEAKHGFTWAERKVLDKEWGKFKKNQKRRELLDLITKEVIDPTVVDKWGVSTDKWGFVAMEQKIKQAQHDAQLRQHIQNAHNTYYTDSRAMYGNPK